MTRINTNVASLRGLRSMQRANAMLDSSLTRLSTGLKINSGKDSPSGLIASETLRSQISAIEQSIRNSNRANNVIGTADSALGEVGNLLNQIRSLVQEGLNEGALSQDEIEANQLQIDAALSAINRISANTTFAGDKLIDGSKAFTTKMSAADAGKLNDFQINEAVFGSSSEVNIDATVIQAAQRGELHYTGGSLQEATTLEVSGSKGSQALFLGGNSTVSDVRNAVNSVNDVTGVSASLVQSLEHGGQAVAANLEFDSVEGVQAELEWEAVDAVAASNSFDVNAGASELTFTAKDAGADGNNIEIVFDNASAAANDATSVTVAGNTITVVLGKDNNGDVDATMQDIIDAIENDQDADDLVAVAVTAGNAGDTFDLNQAATALEDGANAETVTFTAVDEGEVGNNIKIEFVNEQDSANETTVEVDDDDPDNIVITFKLANDGNDVTATVDDLVALLGDPAGEDAAAYINAAGNGSTAIANLADDDLTGGSDAETITFTAVNAGEAGNNIKIEFVNEQDSANETTVEVDDADPENIVITFKLANDGNDVTATNDDLIALLEGAGGADAAAYIAASGGGETAIAELADDDLTGGADDSGSVVFTDARLPGSEGTISVVYADPGEADADLSIEVSDPDQDGNVTITVNLATDGDGVITTTADDLVAAIEADDDASALVSVEAGEEGTLAALASQDLTENEDSTLILTSENYGSSHFVSVNVLSGSFDTTLSDGTTAAGRNTGSDIVATINGQLAQGNGLRATVRTASLDASLDFKAEHNNANETARITITGGGSLFQIGQEVSMAGQIGIGIEAVNTARLGGISGKLYELGSGGGKSLLDVGPNVPGSELVDIIEQAISRVSVLRGRLGAVQRNVIETNISTLSVALENVSEARSQIVDTDFAEETANLTKAQILSQASMSILSIANQNPSQVLNLLG